MKMEEMTAAYLQKAQRIIWELAKEYAAMGMSEKDALALATADVTE